ncbi:efflux RND transporter periplasmic adaptor subunit [Pseudomonas sp. GW460-C8]|uniref:efflux RND transporter periplasmic adaptor subunit n=1 Tax=Pseudomonas sp. GW460-C8 TaxID=2070589 RepID=UPI000C884768|nr:efflux RND transporter periplasmic adaptor subunit [Pseudomonas sp. GW460-C8]PMV97167.1 HlyD family secretion protein [Pseudomonas sp. GW460-C8]
MIDRLILVLALSLVLVSCGESSSAAKPSEGQAATNADYERGPHRGRMLRAGNFALEVTIFETNVPPQYRLYAYQGDTPLDPSEIQATVEVERLDGEVNRFTFQPENDYLTGSGTVVEPHSFYVRVSAKQGDKTHQWEFASYEGRTSIPAGVAKDAGVMVEAAGPAVIRDSVRLVGNVVLDANRRAAIKARFPGIVRAVAVQHGQNVSRGQTLVVVEGNDSLRSYTITAPFDGVILALNTNIGDAADGNTLIEMADMSRVWVELHAIGENASRVSAGQPVRIRAATQDAVTETVIDMLLPLTTRGQSVVARASIANPDGRWRPGMAVEGDVTLDERQASLAVKESGLQRFRDFTVVFAQIGETYEVRMLELGTRDGEYVEVLSGLKPGTSYVTEQSFLIKADIDKSGASHDH